MFYLRTISKLGQQNQEIGRRYRIIDTDAYEAQVNMLFDDLQKHGCNGDPILYERENVRAYIIPDGADLSAIPIFKTDEDNKLLKYYIMTDSGRTYDRI